ncbi:MAG: ParB/RepB/Spo0J family partition protein [Planctomycetes bacterium]|nr:ParB/RepB/Spo0J family partition protein [Planctomycetota bacterium]
MAQIVTRLEKISPDLIQQNPDNPRLIFREEDMQELLDSIKEVGIKVPVSLYSERNHYVLLDGERRWRCAKRLNLHEIPAIVQPKPTRLENLLMMFNIHNVRVDWDPMPMAMKLKEVRELLLEGGQSTNPKELAAVTGLSLASVRRALELLDLPKKYRDLLINESQKPRSSQQIKADLFIEIYKSFRVIEKHSPDVLSSFSKAQYVEAMVEKYKEGVVDNVVSYRQVSKIARSELAGVAKPSTAPAIVRLVREKKYSIKDAYRDTVESAYQNRDLVSKLESLTERLSQIKTGSLASELKDALKALQVHVTRLLKA